MINTGIVIKSTGSWFTVKSEGQVFNCKIKGKFRIKGIRATNPVSVGDFVDFEIIDEDDNTAVINKIHERKNYIIRKSTNLSRQVHILAANIDYALIVATLTNPKTYTEFIDRFLITCEANKITGVIVFNKIDIYDEEQKKYLQKITNIYRKAGYLCLHISVKKNVNISEISKLIKDKTIVMSGNSGVGKSSLINLLQPGLNLKTSEVSDYHHKGKHTTTFAEMFDIAKGRIIDTPGVKGFGLVDVPVEILSAFFPEMSKLRNQCRFNNCTHTHEPDCAVKPAVDTGEISIERYNNYLNIIQDDDTKYRLDTYK